MMTKSGKSNTSIYRYPRDCSSLKAESKETTEHLLSIETAIHAKDCASCIWTIKEETNRPGDIGGHTHALHWEHR